MKKKIYLIASVTFVMGATFLASSSSAQADDWHPQNAMSCESTCSSHGGWINYGKRIHADVPLCKCRY